MGQSLDLSQPKTQRWSMALKDSLENLWTSQRRRLTEAAHEPWIIQLYRLPKLSGYVQFMRLRWTQYDHIRSYHRKQFGDNPRGNSQWKNPSRDGRMEWKEMPQNCCIWETGRKHQWTAIVGGIEHRRPRFELGWNAIERRRWIG